MIGNIWIVYDNARYALNSEFATMLVERFARHGESAIIVMAEDICIDSLNCAGSAINTNIKSSQVGLQELDILSKNKASISMQSGREKKEITTNNNGKRSKRTVIDLPKIAVMRCDNVPLSRALESCGVRVFNSAEVASIANDKWLTYQHVAECGVEILPTYLVGAANKLTYPMVIKSRRGHGGSQVFMVNNSVEYARALVNIGEESVIAQAVASDIGRDVRCYIVGNKLVCAMLRRNNSDFRSNYCLGGSAERYYLNSAEQAELDKLLTSGLAMDFVGIDYIFHNGSIVFNEIEDVVGCRMVYSHTDIDIADIYVTHVLQ